MGLQGGLLPGHDPVYISLATEQRLVTLLLSVRGPVAIPLHFRTGLLSAMWLSRLACQVLTLQEVALPWLLQPLHQNAYQHTQLTQCHQRIMCCVLIYNCGEACATPYTPDPHIQVPWLSHGMVIIVQGVKADSSAHPQGVYRSIQHLVASQVQGQTLEGRQDRVAGQA